MPKLNLAQLLIALPVLCQPLTGSLLRFPDTIIVSFSPEAIDARSFGAGTSTYSHPGLFSGAWHPPLPRVFEEISSAPVLVTTEINRETPFGMDQNLPPVSVYIPDSTRVSLQFDTGTETGEDTDPFFLFGGFICFGAALFIRLPRMVLRRLSP